MKTFQKSILMVIITVVFLDLFTQLTNQQQLITLMSKTVKIDEMAFGVYPIAFLVGCLFSGYFINYFFHFSLISVSLFLLGLCQGGYMIISSYKSFLYLKMVHGFLVALVLTISLTYLINLIEKEKFESEICRYFISIPIFILLLFSFNTGFLEKFEVQWTLFILMFSFIFVSILSLLLMEYLTEINIKITHQPKKQYNNSLIMPGVVYRYLTVIISGFTIGTLFQTFINSQMFPLKFSSPLLISTFLIVLTLTLSTKLGTITNEIGEIKTMLISLLLMSFGLSLLPLLTQSVLLVVNISLFGLAYGLLIPCIWGGIKENVISSTSGLVIGLINGLHLIGYILGWIFTKSIYHQHYSPYLFNSFIIISACIFLISKIHQQAISSKLKR